MNPPHPALRRYSALALLRARCAGERYWRPLWSGRPLRAAYDVVVVGAGAGGHHELERSTEPWQAARGAGNGRLEFAEGLARHPAEGKGDQLVLVPEVMRQHADAEAAGAGDAAHRGALGALLLYHAHRQPRDLLAAAGVIDDSRHPGTACDAAMGRLPGA